MRRFLITWLIVIPLAVIFVVFAVANRHFVTVSFDPFNSSAPSVSVSVPLFVLIIVVAILGVIAGGSAAWFSQRHWRRSARRHEADARTVRTQLDDLRAAQLRETQAAMRADAARLASPSQGGFYGASGRDKQGAVL
jgi:predicted ribosomally synthesized peptide with SipW-like signal peptide